MSRTAIIAAVAALALAPSVLFAQAPATENPSPTLADLHLSCSDFKRDASGSWVPLHSIQLGETKVGAGLAVPPGVSFGGVDLAALINKECAKR